MNHRRNAIFGGAVALSSFLALGAGAAAGAATPHATDSTTPLVERGPGDRAHRDDSSRRNDRNDSGQCKGPTLVLLPGRQSHEVKGERRASATVACGRLGQAHRVRRQGQGGIDEASRWSPGDLQRSLPLHLRRRLPGTRHGTRRQQLLRCYSPHSDHRELSDSQGCSRTSGIVTQIWLLNMPSCSRNRKPGLRVRKQGRRDWLSSSWRA